MKIVLDISGGDKAPKEIINGGLRALQEEKDFSLVMCGRKEEILKCLKEEQYETSRIEIIDARETITNDESPSEAVRTKKESSIVKSLDFLNEHEDAKGFVSAGSTGAVLTGAVLFLKRIRGVNRPALSPLLPTVTNKNVLLIDCGANVEPKPINLIQFAKMGSAYMKAACNVESPKVGLLSNGTEDAKGNALNKETFPQLKSSGINFVGNMEAREILSGDYDVIVSDGYCGNIALKACEGTALSMFSLIKSGIYAGGLRAKIGYLLLKPVFKNVKRKMDYNDNGGAVLLGLQKIVVKSHGSSKAKAICNSILQAKHLAESGVVEEIEKQLRAE